MSAFTGSATSANSGCLSTKPATVGHTATIRRPASRVACSASLTRIVARPRPPNSSDTSVWVKTRWPSRSTNSTNPTFWPSTEMLKRSDSALTVVGAPVLSVVMSPLYAGIGPRAQCRIRQRWGRQTRHASLVTVHLTEAGVVVLPHLSVHRDVVVAAPNEVPPHDQLLGKRRTTEQQDTCRALAAV